MGLFNRQKKEMRMKTEVKTAKDPVCGMDVDVGKPAATSNYQGQVYYFCSLACQKAFDQNPAKYIKGVRHEVTGHSGHHM
jgi:Cu+-exporting ATPase